MLITCPSCATSYQVAFAPLGVHGGKVRCARCKRVWHTASPGVQAREPWCPATTRFTTQPGAGADSAPPTQQQSAHFEDGRTITAATGAINPPGQRHRRWSHQGAGRQRRLPELAALVAVLVGLIVALISWRTAVVRLLPQTAPLFAAISLPVNVRGLDFAGLKSSKESDQGTMVLAVEGRIINITKREMEVPRLVLAVRNHGGQELYAWTVLPTGSVLAPGDSVPFATRLPSAPADAHDVIVRFSNSRDRVP